MQISQLTEQTIRAHTNDDSFERGEAYYEKGAVLSIKQKDPGHLEAHVKGSDVLPYTVDIRYGDDGINDVHCTCPYYAGSWCKHIVATLLTAIRQHDDEDVTSASRLLATLERDTLVHLFEALLDDHPELAPWVRHRLRR